MSLKVKPFGTLTFLAFLLSVQFFYGQITYEGCLPEMNNGAGNYVSFTFFQTASPVNDGGIIRNTFDTSPIDGAQACNTCFGFGYGELRIQWSIPNDRWELQLTGDGVSFFTIYSNSENSYPNPPSTSLGVWEENVTVTGGICGGNGTINTLTGDVQNNTLGLTEVQENQNFKIFPNPTNATLIVSGLKTTKPFQIYNTFGVMVLQGNVSKNGIVSLDSLESGLFIIKIDSKNISKFIKL